MKYGLQENFIIRFFLAMASLIKSLGENVMMLVTLDKVNSAKLRGPLSTICPRCIFILASSLSWLYLDPRCILILDAS